MFHFRVKIQIYGHGNQFKVFNYTNVFYQFIQIVELDILEFTLTTDLIWDCFLAIVRFVSN